MILTLAFILLLSQAHAQDISVIKVDDPNNITIAYGSCLNTFDENPDIEQVLQSIIRTQPDLWMWLGDAVYLDGDSFFFGALPGTGYDLSDADYTKGVFNTLKTNPNYVQLKDNVPIIGTWDDHDYAYDGANKDFEYKDRNKGIYLDFLDEPADSPRRNQPGVYTSYYIGDDKLIKVILLDVRYNRDHESFVNSVLDRPENGDILGEEQWTWLEAQLQDPNGTYTLIASATQYLPNDRPVLPNWFEDSRERLLDLIKVHQKSGVVLLSGDVHYAEIVRHPCPARVGYKNLYEFTSSGLTHTADFIDVFDGVFDTYSSEEDRYFGKNFAVLKFVKAENSIDPPNLVFEARDADGNVVLTREVAYGDLIYDQGIADSFTGCNLDSSSSDEDNEDIGDKFDNAVDAIKDTANDVGSKIDNALDSIGDLFSKNK